MVTVPTWAILAQKMRGIEVGHDVKIVYMGTKKTANGTAKDFEVFIPVVK